MGDSWTLVCHLWDGTELVLPGPPDRHNLDEVVGRLASCWIGEGAPLHVPLDDGGGLLLPLSSVNYVRMLPPGQE